MTRRRTAARPRKTSRRWHIPPPLVHGPEALEGGNVLQEMPDETGALLWQALRDVMLWSQTPPAERAQLFVPDAQERRMATLLSLGLDPALNEPLRTLASLLGEPAELRGEVVALACRQVSQWAEASGLLLTALAYAQGAALACPAEASMAFAVGRIARLAGDHARAEVWLRRTIGLARQARDWRLYSLAFRSLGNLYAVRGNFPTARRLQIRALRGARRGGMRAEQGQALHDLFTIEAGTGRPAQAEEFARQALAAYAPRNPHLPALAHDVAYFWMEQGHFARALPLFEAVQPLIGDPIARLFVTADIARAAGGIGDRDRFEQAWAEVEAKLSEQPQVADGAARALLELAHGASSLSDWERATSAAERAQAIARRRGEAKIQFSADALLEAVHHHQTVAIRQAAREAAPEGEQLARDFVRALEALAVTAG